MRHTGLDSGPPMQFFKNPRPMRGPTTKTHIPPQPRPGKQRKGPPNAPIFSTSPPDAPKICPPAQEKGGGGFFNKSRDSIRKWPLRLTGGGRGEKAGDKKAIQFAPGSKVAFYFCIIFSKKQKKRPQPRKRWLGTLRKMQNFLAFCGPRGYNRGAGKIKAGHEGVPAPPRPYAGEDTSHTADLLRQLPL